MNRPLTVVFLYPGQGSQTVGMARELYTSWPWFKENMDHLFSFCPQNKAVPLHGVMLGLNEQGPLLAQTLYTQPILYALEVMLTKVWARWNVKPDKVLGHSLGEIAAASASGVFTAEEGMRLASERGRLMQMLPQSGRYAVVIGESSEVIEIIHPYKPEAVVGGSNGPNITVVTGKAPLVDEVLAECMKRGMTVRTIPVSLPFHSPLMEPMLDAFDQICTEFKFNPPKLSWVSTMSGQCMNTHEGLDKEYWKAQIIEPVRFWAGMVAATSEDRCLMMEAGCGKTLLNMGKQAIEEENHLWIHSLDPKKRDADALRDAATFLSDSGIEVDMDQVRIDLESLQSGE